MTLQENSKDINPDEVPDNSGIPNIYPPIPTKPEMTVDFNYRLGETVIVSHLEQKGVVVAAAVAFNQTSIIYLVDTDPESKWYPEFMLQKSYRVYEPTPYYDKSDAVKDQRTE
jgi:hypothetical protein